MNSITGIYEIKNTISGDFYIGSTVNFRNRKKEHLSCFRRNVHQNRYLQRAWNKYGENNFSFEIIELCNREDLFKREQYYIELLKPKYNLSPVAGSCLGVKHTKEANEKKSLLQLGNKHALGYKWTEEERESRVKSMGHGFSEETRKNISEKLLGHIVSEETREKISKKNMGNKNCVGRKASQESRDKMTAAHIARWIKIKEKKNNVIIE